ncbi:hypothetical protein GTY77_18120 [Streptomyces sp. SID8380]|nr:hypothetical protein [Streptomyces sp. SID8380]
MGVNDVEDKRYDLILVVGCNQTQARDLWAMVRHKYPVASRVKYVSRNPCGLDGLNYQGMLIVLVGTYWLNPVMDSTGMKWLMKLGAEVVREE